MRIRNLAFILALSVGCAAPVATSRPLNAPAVTSTTTTLPVVTSTTVVPAWAPPSQTQTSGCVISGGVQDVRCTPGALNPRVNQANIKQTICVSGWSTKERSTYLPRTKSGVLKKKVALYYTPRPDTSASEGDHLIPIELGGDPTGGLNESNFWDEPHKFTALDGSDAGSFVKDAFENYLHVKVCARKISLSDAQREMATNWYAAYVAAGKPANPYHFPNGG